MNIFKHLAAMCFRRKPAVSDSESVLETEVSTTEKASPKPEECCKYVKLGKAEYPLFAPYPLMQFYSIYKAYKTRGVAIGRIDQVQLLKLHHPLTKAVLATVWAIEEDDGYVWGEIGNQDVNFSKIEAFDYEPTETFEIVMCRKDGVLIIAECRYRQKEIKAIKLMTEDEATKERQPMKCSKLPCSLEKVAEFLEKSSV